MKSGRTIKADGQVLGSKVPKDSSGVLEWDMGRQDFSKADQGFT
jgi:hypothetical protein